MEQQEGKPVIADGGNEIGWSNTQAGAEDCYRDVTNWLGAVDVVETEEVFEVNPVRVLN
jgi:hypothetical protein